MTHLITAILVFSILDRTFNSGSSGIRLKRDSVFIAFSVSLLWAVHPLTTSAVSYITQRAESLVSMFYLLTIYCVIRSSSATGKMFSTIWCIAAVAACSFGMASKEVMISAPFIIFIYDSLFLSSGMKDALKRRGPLYGMLVLTCGILICNAIDAGGRGGTAGFDTDITREAGYILTQSRAFIRYLLLSYWPSDLVFDYGTSLNRTVSEIWPFLILSIAIVVNEIGVLFYKPRVAFVGLFVFAVLAPSSSIIPVKTQTIAEHRIYLSLSAVILFTVLALHHAWEPIEKRIKKSYQITGALLLILITATILGYMTILRNRDYRSELAIWTDTTKKLPENARAWMYTGTALLNQNQGNPSEKEVLEAIAMLNQAVARDPSYVLSYANRGLAFYKAKRYEEALRDYDKAVSMNLNKAELFNNRGILHGETGNTLNALKDFTAAVKIDPQFALAHSNLGSASAALANDYMNRGEEENAVREFKNAIHNFSNALKFDSSMVKAFKGRAAAYSMVGMHKEAADDCSRIISISPSSSDAFLDRAICHYNLGKYHEAWQDIENGKKLGGLPNPEFIMMVAKEAGLAGNGIENR